LIPCTSHFLLRSSSSWSACGPHHPSSITFLTSTLVQMSLLRPRHNLGLLEHTSDIGSLGLQFYHTLAPGSPWNSYISSRLPQLQDGPQCNSQLPSRTLQCHNGRWPHPHRAYWPGCRNSLLGLFSDRHHSGGRSLGVDQLHRGQSHPWNQRQLPRQLFQLPL
jgi:hypothetical protein